jgi:hypothetical protein
MIRSLVDMRAIGPELATLLVREAFSRPISNRRALGSYAGPSRKTRLQKSFDRHRERRLRTG